MLGRILPWAAHQQWFIWRPRWRIAIFALAGAVVAVALAGNVSADIGPFEATVAARPSWGGKTTIHLAPLGTIVLDTHDWPVGLDLSADEISLREAERIAQHPEVIENQLGDDLAAEVRSALWRLALRCTLLALLGGVVGGLIARAHWQSVVAGVGAGAVLVVGIGAGAAATFDSNAVSEPRYTGVLTAAPTAVGDLESIVDRFGEYRAQLSELVGNVSRLYVAANGLPTFEPEDHTIRLLHVSDVHLNPAAFDVMDQLTAEFDIDAVVDTGDLTDWGTTPETRFADNIGQLPVPYVYVRGNHDSDAIQAAVAEQPNAVVLDGDAATVAGLRIWGIGDPRYTPDKDQPTGHNTEREQAEAFAPVVETRLANDEPPEVDLLMIHDERAAADVGGEVPLVLAGHTHKAKEARIPTEQDDEDDADAGDGDNAADSTGGTDAGADDGAADSDDGADAGADDGAADSDDAADDGAADSDDAADDGTADSTGGTDAGRTEGGVDGSSGPSNDASSPTDSDGTESNDTESVEPEANASAAGEPATTSTTERAETQEPEETILLVEGSTGGAGLRGLQGEEPKPLTATVLYFDPSDRRLVAYDRITVQGFGATGVTIERHVLATAD